MQSSPKNEFKEELRQNLRRADNAVDDSEDLDDDYVEVQKTISGGRRRQSKSLVQEILPFTFSPLTRPLTIRDADCCTALENAAFTHPDHRCTRDKVSNTANFSRFVHYIGLATLCGNQGGGVVLHKAVTTVQFGQLSVLTHNLYLLIIYGILDI